MLDVVETVIPARNVRSLVWDGDTLVDFAAGGTRYSPKGVQRSQYFLGFAFDGVRTLGGARHVVLYTRFGTKGVLMLDERVVREIDRSYYFAGSYEFPVALFQAPSGRAAIAHCPDAYNRIEIDDLETGKRLTASRRRKPSDVFHSRLAVSPCGRYLLSAGWVWHPLDTVHVFDIAEALRDPRHLDGKGVGPLLRAEASSAAFRADGTLIVALTNWLDAEGDEVMDSELRVYTPARESPISARTLDAPVGTVMPVGAGHVLALHGHPRLLDLHTGETLRSWPELATGTQKSSIANAAECATAAVDVERRRIAVAGPEAITVLTFETAAQGEARPQTV